MGNAASVWMVTIPIPTDFYPDFILNRTLPQDNP